MSTKVRLGWLHGLRWALAVCVLLGIALAAFAWEDDGSANLSVRLRAGLSAAEQAAVIARHGGTGESTVAPLRIHVVRVPSGDLPAVLADYQADPQVESAEEVRSRRAEWLPNDPQIGSQWALERIGWPAVYSTQIPTGTATVALLDTGVDAVHPDLVGRLLPGASFIDGADGRTDPSGHGTRLAGLISAVADNGEGIAGVAYAGVKVMPVTVLDAGGVGPDNAIVAGIVWAADHGADVILMGFSGPDPSRHLQDAIDYAWAKGAVLVAATGNGGVETPTYPAANRGVIGIAATTPDDGLADFSNRGPAVFLAAPGVDLVTTEGPDGYTAVSGTSAAAALTAGAAVLLKALDPTLTNGVLLGRLARGAAPAADPRDPAYAAKYGFGRLDLGGALADALTTDAMEPVAPVGALVAADEPGTPTADGVSGGTSGAGNAMGDTATSRVSMSEAAPPPGVTWLRTSNLGANQMTLSFWSRAPGNGWFTLLVGSDTPCGTVAQITAGQDSTGAAALRRGSLKLTANTAVNYTVRNLMQRTAYRVCFISDNGDRLLGLPSPPAFTTTAATTLGSTWATVGSAGFSAGMANYTSLALAPDGTPYVAYVDRANAQKATVMKFDGTAWVTVGGVGFSAGSVWFTSLTFAPDGTPYVAYWDEGNDGKATVMKFNGTAWVTVGDAGFSAGYAASISPAFAPDGTPYVAYTDGGNANEATVMKFDGTAWVTVGNAGFSAGPVLFTSLAVAPDGTPYVTYVDETNLRTATVMKFDGTAWVTVGSDWSPAGTSTSLAFAPDGTPFVTFVDWGNDYKATVIKFDGTAWVAVGRVGFSAGRAGDTSLAFAPDGTPFVAIADGANDDKATVMKFDGTAWITAGSAGFSAGGAHDPTLAFAPDGTPLVAYLDCGNDFKATVMKLTVGAPPPPTLGTPGISNLGANQVTLDLTFSSTGTGWFTLLAGSGTACGTGAQVQAGQDSTGAQAFRHGSLPLTADTAGSYTVRNLTERTDYRVCFTADDGTHLQETPATVDLRTTAAATASETWGLVGTARFYGGHAHDNSLAFAPDGTPYLAFVDETQAGKATVMKFDGTAWGTVGDAGFSAGGANDPTLAFAPDGTPYVAYVDESNGHKATVMKFDGTSWVTVGNAGFSAGFAPYPSLAFAPDGTPYVAYEDWANSGKTTVMKLDGGSWVSAGNAGFSADEAWFPSLAFGPDGTPYVAYADVGNDRKATVMKLDGGSWVSAGNAGFSADEAWFPSLAFAPDGAPYVAYADVGNDRKATVMRLDGSSWVPVGNAGFSGDRAFEISLSFAPDGTPYVAYRATVMKFDGTSWLAVGNPRFSAGYADFTSLAFAPDGTPYVAYLDDLSGAIDIFGNPEPNPIGLTVMKLLPPSVTLLDSAPNPATAGTLVTFTATVSPGTATGSVTLWDGTTALGNPPVNAGTATFSTSTLGVGVHGITAVYSGDAGYGASTSAELSQTIARADQTIAFANPGPRTYGTSPTLTATAGSGLPVTFSSATGAVCAVTSGGTLNLLDLGTCTIAADQAGDGHYNPAPRVTQTFAVTPATLTIVSALVMPKVYDGTTAAAITGTLTGIVGTDQVTLNGTGSFAGADAGTGIAVSSTVTLGGAHAAKYLPAQPTGLTGTIEARPVTIAADSQTKIAGDADPALTYQVSSGSLVAGDGFSGGLSRAPGEAVGTYAITQGTLTLGANYALSYVGADLIIARPAVAPTISILAAGNLGANQVTLNLQSTAGGTGYLTLLPGSGAACGTGAQVQAGQDSTGAAALCHGSLPLTADTAGSYTVRNLSERTGYTVCFTADDGITLQGTPVTADFITTAATALRVTWGTVGGAGFSAAGASDASLAVAPDGTPYVAYVDWGTANHATVTKLAGGSWITVGAGTGSYATSALFTSLAFAPDGTPYVAYRDESKSGKATVVKFDGSSWVTVGGAGFSGGRADFTSLVFGPDGAPYVAYADGGNSGKATVMRFDGSSWATVGSAGFSAGQASSIALALAPNGTPYVTYADAGNANQATVMKFDGTSWAIVGNTGFSAGTPSTASLAFAPDGTPYVAFTDEGNAYRATVTKFDGNSWVTVGSAGFSAGLVYSMSLAIAPDGTPYVAYRDELSPVNPDKTTVMKFNGTAWAIVGNAGFSAGTGGSTSLVFAPDGTPYVAFGATVMKLLPAVGTPTDPTVTIRPAGIPGANQLTLGLESSATGTGYFTLLAGSGTPCGTGAQVEAGQDGTGAAAWRRGSLKLTANRVGSYTVRNLTESTDYRVCFTADDGIGLQSTPAAADLATTAAAPFSATWGTVGSAGFVTGGPSPASLAFDPFGTPYVASPGEPAVTKLSGTSWVTAGGAGFSDGRVSGIALAFAPDGTLYAAYRDRSNPGLTTVMKLDGPGYWVPVGGAGFSSGWTEYPALAIGPDGTPYLAYAGAGDANQATVVKFDGTSWVTVGSAGFSAAPVSSIALALAPDGTPYVAFGDGANSGKATVMRFDGTAWVTVGNPGFSAEWARFTSLAFAPDGTAYAAYREGGGLSPATATVVRLEGTAWVTVGGAGFSTADVSYTSLAFAADGTPYVAYTEADVAYTGADVAYTGGDQVFKATVMKLAGTSWVPVGSAGIAAGPSPTALVFAPDGTPYMAYSDAEHNGRTTVMRLLTPSTIRLDASPNPAKAGTAVRFSATVEPIGNPLPGGLPSPDNTWGTVTFKDGTTTLGNAALLNGGWASFSTSTLAPGDHSITALYSGGSYLGSTSAVLTLTIARADQTIAFANPGSQVYGTPRTLTATAGSGLPVTFSSATGAICTVTTAGSLSLLTVGTCTIDADQAGDGNYHPAPRVSRSFVVTPAALAIAAPAVPAKVYDGAAAALITGTLAGVVGTDQVTLNGTGTFAGSGVGSGIAVTSTATLGGLDAAKYTLSQPVGLSGTIIARPVTVTADAKSKTFGDADPTLTYQVTSGSLVPDDAFSGSLSRTAGEAVGTYPIGQGTLTLGANYALGFTGANLTIGQVALTSVTVTTVPPGRTITVDGQSYTAPQTFQWAPGSGHRIGATQYQDGSAGRRYAFGAWSDGGAMTHTITVPAAAATLTAGFDTQYQLSTAITPAGTGTVSPATGGWYAAETAVTVKAFPSAGYGFVGWEGPVADPQAATTSLTLSAPVVIVAKVAGNPVLTAAIAGKSGPAPARVWTLKLGNTGQSTAQAARIDGLTLTQTFGPACTPVIAPQFPVLVGDIPVGGTAGGAVTIDFGACAATARFIAGIGHSANGGALSGTNNYGNQFR